MHGSRAVIGRVNGRAHPLEIANFVSRHAGMNVRRLRHERRPYLRPGNRLCQKIRWRCAQRLVHILKMLAVKLVEIAVVRRMMFRPVPPIPITAFRNQEFIERESALRLGRAGRGARIKLPRVMQIVPRPVILRRPDPHVEVRINPGQSLCDARSLPRSSPPQSRARAAARHKSAAGTRGQISDSTPRHSLHRE